MMLVIFDRNRVLIKRREIMHLYTAQAPSPFRVNVFLAEKNIVDSIYIVKCHGR